MRGSGEGKSEGGSKRRGFERGKEMRGRGERILHL